MTFCTFPDVARPQTLSIARLLGGVFLSGLLVLLQLDGAKQVQARERMTRQAALAVAVAQEAVDAPLAHAVAGIVRVRQGKALEDPELRFDEVHPRGVGGREDRRDAQASQL